MVSSTANIPGYYDPARVGELYLPDLPGAVAAGQAAALTPAERDTRRVALLLVDPQIDFIFEKGSLSVPGALDDTRRLIEWIYRHAGRITNITSSLDSHTAYQIFYPTWWGNERGEHPAPFTVITAADLRNGVWKPLLEPEWSRAYVEHLDAGGRYSLIIWPYHTMLGTPGHAVVPALAEAIMFHAVARQTQPEWLVKGSLPRTENYSIFEPEVKLPDQPESGLHTGVLQALAGYDAVYVAGQAKSHCVLWTLRSILKFYAGKPEIIAKFHLLTDCTSSVAHPEIDFDALADEELAAMANEGLRLVTSQDSLA